MWRKRKMKIDQFTYFYPEAPRLMSIKSPVFQKLSDDPQWVAEKKYNENRLELHVNATVTMESNPKRTYQKDYMFWNRHKELFGYSPSKELSDALAAVPWKGYCLLDGGLRNNKTVGIKNKIVFYDVFIWNGELLIGKPFLSRRKILEDLFPIHRNGEILAIPEWFDTDFGKVFNEVTKDPEIEGLVMKDINGKLNLGRNRANDSAWMMKVRKGSGRYRF
jgi:hypothetical protein